MIRRENANRYIAIGGIIIVLVIGLAIYLATRGGGGSSTTAQAEATTPVVVALVDVPQGTVFQAGQPLTTYFAVKQVSLDAKPLGAYTSVSQIEAVVKSTGCEPANQPGCRGQITTTQTIYRGLPVVSGMFSTLGPYRQFVGPSFRIPFGYVAISLNVGGDNAVSGSIQAGDTVDLIASYQGTGKNVGNIHAPAQTQYIMTNVKVIGVGIFAPPSSTTGSTEAGSAQVPSSGSLVILARYQQALVIQHLKDFGWQISAVLLSAHQTAIPHFSTVPVTDRWFFVKMSNPFRSNPGY
jgi:Flp pilus assembly protein CpaB